MRLRTTLAALALLLCAPFACAQRGEDDGIGYAQRALAPPGYPAAYQATVRAAEDEGRLVVYSTSDEAVVRPLIADFRSRYPRIEVEYEELSSTELHHRFIAESQLGDDTADVLWSSAMDQQARLVRGGYALPYASPEADHLPAWARWGELAWATTFEPIVFVYHRPSLDDNEVPRSHAEFAKLLAAAPARLRGKVITYDIQKSGLGFLLAAQDAAASAAFWDIARGLGRTSARYALTSEAMLRSVRSGQSVLGYNVLGSYALAQARRDPALGVVMPNDYTLVMSRVLLIARRAAHPNAARLWVDHLLSPRGQALVAQSGLYAVRGDVDGETTATRLAKSLGPALRPIPLDASLTDGLDGGRYRAFVQQWQQATTVRP